MAYSLEDPREAPFLPVIQDRIETLQKEGFTVHYVVGAINEDDPIYAAAVIPSDEYAEQLVAHNQSLIDQGEDEDSIWPLELLMQDPRFRQGDTMWEVLVASSEATTSLESESMLKTLDAYPDLPLYLGGASLSSEISALLSGTSDLL